MDTLELVPWLQEGLLISGLLLVSCNFALLLVMQIQKLRERNRTRGRDTP